MLILKSENHDKMGKLWFMDFTFHANCEKWNHAHNLFTEILITIHSSLVRAIWLADWIISRELFTEWYVNERFYKVVSAKERCKRCQKW